MPLSVIARPRSIVRWWGMGSFAGVHRVCQIVSGSPSIALAATLPLRAVLAVRLDHPGAQLDQLGRMVGSSRRCRSPWLTSNLGLKVLPRHVTAAGSRAIAGRQDACPGPCSKSAEQTSSLPRPRGTPKPGRACDWCSSHQSPAQSGGNPSAGCPAPCPARPSRSRPTASPGRTRSGIAPERDASGLHSNPSVCGPASNK